jgi:hypothetical protein
MGSAVFVLLQVIAGAGGAPPERLAPVTPPGLAPCVSPLTPAAPLPAAVGETIRYVVDVDGLSVGTVDFRIERQGTLAGRAVTEYRTVFKIDQLVSTAIPADGRAAAIVPVGTFWPAQSMSRYKLNKDDVEEDTSFGEGGRSATCKRTKNHQPNTDSRVFPGPAQDFVTAFYLLRALAPDAKGCAIVYGAQRVYTIWLEPDGEEQVMTPVGLKTARRYGITYGHDRSKKPVTGRLWLGTTADRLPYKGEVNGTSHLEARIHLYETGKP